MSKIPNYIKILALTIPILKWKNEENLSRGEIKKFNFVESDKNKHKFNDQICSFEDDYSWIWRHIVNDYFKCIGKSYER